jgi:hypothetical protein
MSRPLVICAALLALVALATAEPALAQPGRYTRSALPTGPGPRLSPYLNLLRNRTLAGNYYLDVLPITEQRDLNLQFNRAIQDLEEKITVPPEAEDARPILPGTGHPVQFMNLSPYYNLGGPRRASPTYVQPPARGRRGR